MNQEIIMGVAVSLPLFAEPGKELEDRGPITGKQLRNLGEELRDRLEKAAAILDNLLTAGWTAQTAANDVLLHHPEVQSQEEAIRRLRELGIDLEQCLIFKDVEDEA
jgi:hypothetical protein